MNWIMASLITASMASITGIIAVGDGKHWEFKVSDYFRGQRAAILYLWVTLSTIFSLLHGATIIEYGAHHSWDYSFPGHAVWFALHTSIGILLTIAHLFVRGTMKGKHGHFNEKLWGK